VLANVYCSSVGLISYAYACLALRFACLLFNHICLDESGKGGGSFEVVEGKACRPTFVPGRCCQYFKKSFWGDARPLFKGFVLLRRATLSHVSAS
jgi:hypothetical protein